MRQREEDKRYFGRVMSKPGQLDPQMYVTALQSLLAPVSISQGIHKS